MSLVDRVKNITLRPNAEWPVIAGEASSLGGLYSGYVAPLAAINPIALFIGLSIVGVSIPFVGTYRTPFFSGLSQAILSFVFALIGVLLMAALVNFLAPTFGGRRNFVAAVKLVAYSATPGFVAGVLSIFPPLAMLEILAAFWGLYLFFVGVPVVMQTSRDKALAYTAVTMVCAFMIGFVLSMVIGATIGVARFATGGFAHHDIGATAPGSDEAQAKAIAATVIANAMGGADSDKKQAESVVNSVAQAGKDADTAAASGNTDAQAQAGVNMLKSLVTAGKGDVKLVPREALKALLPDSVAGLPSWSAESKTGSFAGISAAGASATYGDSAHNVELSVGDMGNVGGLAMLANMGANLVSSDSDEGYEKTVEVDGRKVHEKWTNAGKHSEVFEIIDNRFAISVDSSGVDMDTAVRVLTSVDADRLSKLQS